MPLNKNRRIVNKKNTIMKKIQLKIIENNKNVNKLNRNEEIKLLIELLELQNDNLNI